LERDTLLGTVLTLSRELGEDRTARYACQALDTWAAFLPEAVPGLSSAAPYGELFRWTSIYLFPTRTLTLSSLFRHQVVAICVPMMMLLSNHRSQHSQYHACLCMNCIPAAKSALRQSSIRYVARRRYPHLFRRGHVELADDGPDNHPASRL
jgi:hypothetical protein